MYRFVKLHHEKYNISYPWMLECKSLDIVRDHANVYLKSIIGDGMNDLLKHITKGYHISTYWAQALQIKFWDREVSVLKASTELELQLLTDKLEVIENQGGIYLTDGPSYMPFTDDFEELDVILKEDISFPFYSEKDINIKRWNLGVHYYATIGNIDVVINGVKKWNTPEHAKRMALKFLKDNL